MNKRFESGEFVGGSKCKEKCDVLLYWNYEAVLGIAPLCECAPIG